MQDNAIIIKLQDSDITSAQDDPDIEGIIHIPSIEYDHCVQEVQVPGQSFFNELYINVQDLEIGGSGLPIIINGLGDGGFDSAIYPTSNFLTVPINGSTTVELNQYEAVYVITRENNYYYLRYQINIYSTPRTVTLTNTNFLMKYVVIINDSLDELKRFYVNNTPIMGFRFVNSGNSLVDIGSLDRNFFEIDWGN